MSQFEDTIQRIIEKEIFVNASTMISTLTQTTAAYVGVMTEDLMECSVRDDYREPVEDAIRNGTPAMLIDTCERFGYDCVAIGLHIGGRVLSSEDDVDDDDSILRSSEHIDCQSIIDDMAADDNWQEVADWLDIEPHQREALQHWLVSDWLADELEAVGALVARDVLGFEVWGRTECGQPLTMDSDLMAVAQNVTRRLHEALHGPALDQDAAHYGTAE